MIYNYTITTKLKEIKKGKDVYSKVLKDVSITASEALKLYLRHHKKFDDKCVIKKRVGSLWHIITASELEKEITSKVKGKKTAYKINV